MSFRLVTTQYGRPAVAALAAAVGQAKAGEPLAPVTVAVPSNHAGVTLRRALARGDGGALTPAGRGVVGVLFLTVARLAELMAAANLAAVGRRPAPTPVVIAAIRGTLAADPGVFRSVASHPATEEALVSAYADMAGLSPAARRRLAGASPRAADVVRICGAARAHLSGGWYDETDLLFAARRAAAEERSPLALGQLVVYLPQDLTEPAAELLREVARLGEATVIAGWTGRPRADDGVRRTLVRLGVELPAAPAAGTPGDAPGVAAWPVSASATRIVTASDADEEVRLAVRAVVEAARDSHPLDRMAILFPAAQPYARLIHEQLAAAGVTHNGTAFRSLAESALGRAVSGLLALPEHGYRRADVLDLLTSAPLVTGAEGPPPTAAWERLSRRAAVIAGGAHWDRRLSDLAESLERRADELAEEAQADSQPDGDEDLPAPSQRLRRDALRARELRDLVLDVIDSLDRAAVEDHGWRSRVQWLRRLSSALFGGDAARSRWPEVERKAAERVEAALDRLAAADDVDASCPLPVFRRALALELDADLGRVGRFGEGLLVAPLSFGIGLDLDLAVVVGAAEGLLPARHGDDSLLPDHERVLTRGQLRLRAERLGLQERWLHATLSGAAQHLLTAPRGDLRTSSGRSVSRWLEEMSRQEGGPLRQDAPSFAYGIAHSRAPATAQEFRLAAGPDRSQDPVVFAGRETILARHGEGFTRFDGNLAGLPVSSPDDDVVSATRLESWATCPHAYFMRRVLGVEPVEDPADVLWISPLDKGSLVHEVLEQYFQDVMDRPGQPDPATPWSEADHELMQRIAADVCDGYEARGVVGRVLFWRRDRQRILAQLDRFLADDDRQRGRQRSHPVAAEMAFGLPGADRDAVPFPIDGGRQLQFRGSVDRIDRAEDGTLAVIDYKTGKPGDYLGLSEENPDDRGTHLQLAVYGLAARAHLGEPGTPVGAWYWFLSDNDRLKTVGYQVTDDVVGRVGRTLATIVDGIAAGVFPSRPTASASDPYVRCRYCDPDGLGVVDRRREWERKRHDTGIRVYAALAEPGVTDAEPA